METQIGCLACGDVVTRRGFLGQVSAAALTAMIGLEASPGTALAFPVVEGSSSQTGATERTFPLPAADGVTIDRDAQVILVRLQQRVYAFNLACPHENTALRWRQNEGRFQCPRHESKYRPDGTFIEGRATRNMDRFPIRRAGTAVVLDLNKLLRSDQQPSEWSAAFVSV